MRFPSYWAQETNPRGTLVAYGWSDISQHDAENMAKERFGRILTFLRNDDDSGFDERGYHYLIGDIIREEVLERFPVNDQSRVVISRNTYGAAVLNAEQVLFIDIDVIEPYKEEAKTSLLDNVWRWLTLKPAPEPAPPRDYFAEKLADIRAWQATNPQYTLKVYRTHSGYRCVVLNEVFSDMNVAKKILEALGSDRLYIRLCEQQQCFRARLTPKPWRMGMARLGATFPYDPKHSDMIADYLQDYTLAASGYAVCHEVETLGRATPHETVALVLGIHDDLCSLDKDLPLA